ncbi:MULTISPECIES: hypothetical protein [unclassified Streptomyces]|uniref:hypothetical protein n=1 Tax=Streptomyces TaxID=1883 RepID=UPI00136F3F1D|nr:MULTISPECIES: hypothetical protein [unclassified Streptomyces]NEA05898.1 hypothetical protein [Streptomyces sp. SID10116]MYY84710.1 hypothetical protein [Streptomyces sp. SID335]MYY87116.1 hypothetical protein [Streptomyces sp. SID335]MYZ18472.1 hypothetical protein [Streptomyces sp. SID337]NDZ90948.1 hypothetical protein [Streptomyces sp. SID10115]
MTLTSAAAVTPPAQDRCPVCHEAAEGEAQWWTLRSRHRTSEGDVEYCTGGCGCLVVLVNGELLKALPVDRR